MPINNFKDDEEMKQDIRFGTIIRLFSYLKPHSSEAVRTLLLMAIVIFIELLNPYFMKISIDDFIRKGNWKGLILLGVAILAINIVSMFCTRKRIVIMAAMTNKILVTIRQELYTHMQKLPFSFFDERPVGKLLARIIGDVSTLNDLFTNSITSLIPEIFKVVAVMTIMFALNVWLALAALATLPFLLGIMIFISRKSHKRWQIYRNKKIQISMRSHMKHFRACASFRVLPRKNRLPALSRDCAVIGVTLSSALCVMRIFSGRPSKCPGVSEQLSCSLLACACCKPDRSQSGFWLRSLAMSACSGSRS